MKQEMIFSHKIRKLNKALLGFGLLAVMILPTNPLHAGNLSVDVTIEGYGQKLSGASVCIGTPENPASYGSKITNGEGNALFADIPDGNVQLTVSKDGFHGHSRVFSKTQSVASVYVPLKQGEGGTTCVAATVKFDNSGVQTKQQNNPLLQLISMKINRNATSTNSQTVTLNNQVGGSPTMYRASEKSDFSDANWQPYSDGPSYILSNGKGNKTVYFQIRKVTKMDKGEITRDSSVVTDVIRLY